jgi:thiol:disulfide interchange protein DsbD
MFAHAKLTIAAVAAVALAATAQAQNPVHWTGTATAKSVTQGGKTSVKLDAKIDEGWHIYSITQGPGGPFPTKVSVPDKQPVTLGGDVKAGIAPDVSFDKNFGIDVETYEDKAEFVVPVKVDKDAKTGKQTIEVATRYQACNASMCLPPRTEKVKVALNVKGEK